MTANASDANLETAGRRYSVCGGWCLWLACLTIVVVGKQICTNGNHAIEETSTITAKFVVNLNAAQASELAALPEVGSALASRIVEHREQHGQFTSVDDVTHVPGVGPKTLELLRPMLTVSPTSLTNDATP